MNTIKPIEKSQTKSNKEIVTSSNQEYQNNNISENISEMEIIATFYLIFRMFRKIKMNIHINLRISGKNKKRAIK